MMYRLLLFFTFLYPLLAQATTDKYRLVWSADPSTAASIGWNQIDGNNPQVYFGTVDFGTDISQYSNSQTPDRIENDDTLFEVADALTGEFYEVSMTKGMNNHFVRLTDLQPDTKYYFVIADDNSVSERFWFKTAPDHAGARMSVIAGGDSRNNRLPRQNANKLVAKLRPDCVMFGGDMTDDDTKEEWMEWFDDWQLTIAEDGRMTPIIPARGNHELLNGVVQTLFDVPVQEYYANSIAGNLMRAYTLNSMVPVAGTQAQWFAADLAQNPCHYWKLTQYHFPVRPHESGKIDSEQQYIEWVPLMEQFGVQLSVECDAHVVKVTKPIKSSLDQTNPTWEAGFVEAAPEDGGIVYVGEGCWGAPLRDADDLKSWSVAGGRFNQIKWLWIDQEKIETRTIKTDNADAVGTLTDANRFSIPTNIDLWDMDMGETVLTLTNPNENMPQVNLGDDREIDNDAMITLDAGAGFDSYQWSTGATTQTIEVSESGTYRVTVRLGDAITGCSATDEIIVRESQADALPLELLNFQGTAKAVNNILNWTTANENNVDYYAVERAVDGEDFTVIGKKAATNQASNTYQFADLKSPEGLTYYRLKSYDRDGTTQFSKIIQLEREVIGLQVGKITPNPVYGEATVTLATENPAMIHYEIRDITGRILVKNTHRGNGTLTFATADWLPGVYFLVVEQRNKQRVQRFIKG